jgi:peroxiredoxin
MGLLRPGVEAPDFELTDTCGNIHRLSLTLAAGPLILVFYKSSCPTSQLTLPYIRKIAAEERALSACSVWGISQDEPEETRTFTTGFEFPVLIDEHPYAVSCGYGIERVPSLFIVEPSGLLSLSDDGFSKDTLDRIARRVAECTKGKSLELFAPDDRLPAVRPGCRSRN